MKKSLLTFFSVIMIILLFLIGCNKIIASSQTTNVAESDILEINWQWIELDSNNGNPVIVVNGPAKYILDLKKDGTFSIVSDCNSGSGKFIINNNELDLDLEQITNYSCGEESLSDQYISYLTKVISFSLKEDRLYLGLKSNEGEMIFVNGG